MIHSYSFDEQTEARDYINRQEANLKLAERLHNVAKQLSAVQKDIPGLPLELYQAHDLILSVVGQLCNANLLMMQIESD